MNRTSKEEAFDVYHKSWKGRLGHLNRLEKIKFLLENFQHEEAPQLQERGEAIPSWLEEEMIPFERVECVKEEAGIFDKVS